jgi:hypothetical protein
MIVASKEGKATVHGLSLNFSTVLKGKIYFSVEDSSKWWHEKGHTKQCSRVIRKDKTISFDGVTLDISKINGMDLI